MTQTPDLEARGGFWNDMESPVRWSEVEEADHGLTRVVDPDSRSRGEKGVLERTWRALLGARRGKRRTYGLTRVVYPDPRSRGEKGVLGRHEEPGEMRSVRRSDRELPCER